MSAALSCGDLGDNAGNLFVCARNQVRLDKSFRKPVKDPPKVESYGAHNLTTGIGLRVGSVRERDGCVGSWRRAGNTQGDAPSACVGGAHAEDGGGFEKWKCENTSRKH
jgi:hypothetical protein